MRVQNSSPCSSIFHIEEKVGSVCILLYRNVDLLDFALRRFFYQRHERRGKKAHGAKPPSSPIKIDWGMCPLANSSWNPILLFLYETWKC